MYENRYLWAAIIAVSFLSVVLAFRNDSYFPTPNKAHLSLPFGAKPQGAKNP